MKGKVAIIGGGLVGAHLACLLARRDYEVEVYEKRPDMRKVQVSAGRSINLALSDRGWISLELTGVDRKIREIAIPMKGRMIHGEDGQLHFQPYGEENQAIYSVSRAQLNQTLLDFAEQFPNVSLHFETQCVAVDLDKPSLSVKNLQNGEVREIEADFFIGADGAYSVIRYHMLKLDRFDYCQTYLQHGYKELSIAPDPNGKWKLEPNALHIWPRHQFMLIALPNIDGSFTCTLFLSFEGAPSFSELDTDDKVRQFFEFYFPDTVSLLEDFPQIFFHNPTSSLVTIRCYPWSYAGRFLLIGDAAHAIVPFYGQGVNSGFEDCRILIELLEKYNDDWTIVLEEFQRMRKPDADAISELAMRNFVEMRDHVADPKFLLRKVIERALHKQFPKRFLPVYTIVTFSPQLPYHKALEEQQRQDQMFNEIFHIPDLESVWQTEDGWKQILRIFEKYYAPDLQN